jgi:anti-sigma factor RsiW
MTCAEFVEVVTTFLDGDLGPDEEEPVAKHLAGCDGCRTYLAQFRATVEELGHLPEQSVTMLPVAVRDSLMAAFRERHEAP